jgi:hypothetical protein
MRMPSPGRMQLASYEWAVIQRVDGLLGGVVGFGVQLDRVVQSCWFGDTRVHT